MDNVVVTLSSSKEKRLIDHEGIPVIQFPISVDIASSPVSIQLFKEFSEVASGADLLHYHFPWPFTDLLHLLKGKNKPSIVTYHSDVIKHRFLKIFYKHLMFRFLNSVNRIVPTSENYLRSSKDLQRYKGKATVIPIGVDEFKYPPVNGEKRKYWQQRVGDDFFLFVGVLRPYKGLHVLLQAARKTAQKIVIVGSGPTEKSLMKKISKYKINNVTLTGALPEEDKVVLLSLCRGVVFPSHQRAEAFGVTLVEALMFGKPIISTELGTGTSYVNKHGVTGLVVQANEPSAFAEAIEMLTADSKMTKKMGIAARKRYDELFKPEVMGDKYLSLYEAVLRENA